MYIRLFLKPFLYFNILSIIWQLLLSVKWRHLFSYQVKTGPIYGIETNIKSGNGWFYNFMVLAIYQIILHLNEITMFENNHFQNCVYFRCFFSVLKPQCTAKWHVFYIRNRHISFSQLFCLQVRSVTPWQLHDRKSRCLRLRGRWHS